MTGYILRRLIGAVTVLAILSVVVFLMVRSTPGDVLLVKLSETGRVSDEQMAEMRAELGLDRPLLEQYATWAGEILRGDMGMSLLYDDEPVAGLIVDAIPATAELAVLTILFALVMGLSVGTLSAVFQGTFLDYATRVLAIIGLSAPTFWLALLVIIYAAIYFNYNATSGYVPLWEDPVHNLTLYAVPVVILGFRTGATLMRFTRSSMLEVLRQDYMRTAQAKGLSRRVAVVRHGLRNALIPVLTMLGNEVAFLLSGSVLAEVIFGLPGLGRLTFQAILTRDYTLVQGTALFTGSIVILANLLVDLSYGALDPRVRYS